MSFNTVLFYSFNPRVVCSLICPKGEEVQIPANLMSYSIQRHKEKGSESATAVQDVSQLVWREEGGQIDLNSCNLDPIVSLFLSLCRLCVVEKVFVSGGLIDVVSPQLSSTVAWGLSQVTHPYIHLSEDCYDQVNPLHPFILLQWNLR